MVAEQLPDVALLVFDRDLGVELVTGAADRAAGGQPEEVLGRILLELLPPGRVERTPRPVHRAVHDLAHAKLQPGAVVMDLSRPVLNGLDANLAVRGPPSPPRRPAGAGPVNGPGAPPRQCRVSPATLR